jgi:hypothetical protein
VRLDCHRERCDRDVVHSVVRLSCGDALHSNPGRSECACDEVSAISTEQAQDLVRQPGDERNPSNATQYGREWIKSTDDRKPNDAHKDDDDKKFSATSRMCCRP